MQGHVLPILSAVHLSCPASKRGKQVFDWKQHGGGSDLAIKLRCVSPVLRLQSAKRKMYGVWCFYLTYFALLPCTAYQRRADTRLSWNTIQKKARKLKQRLNAVAVTVVDCILLFLSRDCAFEERFRGSGNVGVAHRCYSYFEHILTCLAPAYKKLESASPN